MKPIREPALAIFFACLAWSQTASFPGSVVTDNQLKVVANNCQTTITFPVETADTTIQVSNGSCIPANSVITLDNENIAICASSANALTVGQSSCPNTNGRGFDNTAAATHAATGANCNPGTASGCASLYIDAWHHNATRVEVEAIENALGANLSNVLSNPGTYNAANYNFTPQTPGGSIAIGSNPVTLTPCPPGVNGSDSGHPLYLQGGTGTAEPALITGGTCTAGATSGTVILTAAHTHTGAWTIGPASGGLQEAVCAMPSTGGQAIVPSSITLLAHVSTCGKWPVSVLVTGGSITFGAFQIFTNASGGYYSALTGGAGVFDAKAFWETIDSSTQARKVGVNGLADAPSTDTEQEGVGVFGGVTNASPSVNGVAGSFEVMATGAGTDTSHRVNLWGLNTIVEDGLASANYNNVYLTNEYDFNVFNSGSSVVASSIGGASTATPGTALGYACNSLSGASVGTVMWNACLISLDGTSTVGIQLGALHTGNNTSSQSIEMFGRNSGGTNQLGQLFEDASGNLNLESTAGINFTVTGSPDFASLNSSGLQLGNAQNVVVPNIKSTTGQRYVCVTTTGELVSSATACSGT